MSSSGSDVGGSRTRAGGDPVRARPGQRDPGGQPELQFASTPQETAGGPAARSGEESAPVWYVGKPGGEQEGPLSFRALQDRAAAGKLPAESLVWKSGFEAWVPASTIAGLFGAAGSPPPLGDLPPLQAPAKGPAVPAKITALLWHPMFFSTAGLVCASAAVLVLIGSLVGLYWRRTWFDGVGLFLLMFFVCQAAGAVLAAVARLESRSKGPS